MIKSYRIKIGESYKKNSIEYYCNSTKTVKDLKNFICDLYNYKFCPCKIRFYVKDYYYEKKYINYKDKSLLSSLDIEDNIFVDINSNIKCICSNSFQEYNKKSKEEIIDLLNKNKEDLEETIKELENNNEILEKKNSEKEKKIEKLLEKKNAIEKDLKVWKDKTVKKDEKINKLTIDKQEIKEKNIELNINIIGLKDTINRKDNLILDLKGKENDAKFKIKNLENNLQLNKGKLDDISIENNNFM